MQSTLPQFHLFHVFYHKVIGFPSLDFTNLSHLMIFMLDVLQRAFNGDGIRVLDDDQRRVGTVVCVDVF